MRLYTKLVALIITVLFPALAWAAEKPLIDFGVKGDGAELAKKGVGGVLALFTKYCFGLIYDPEAPYLLLGAFLTLAWVWGMKSTRNAAGRLGGITLSVFILTNVVLGLNWLWANVKAPWWLLLIIVLAIVFTGITATITILRGAAVGFVQKRIAEAQAGMQQASPGGFYIFLGGLLLAGILNHPEAAEKSGYFIPLFSSLGGGVFCWWAWQRYHGMGQSLREILRLEGEPLLPPPPATYQRHRQGVIALPNAPAPVPVAVPQPAVAIAGPGYCANPQCQGQAIPLQPGAVQCPYCLTPVAMQQAAQQPGPQAVAVAVPAAPAAPGRGRR